MPQKHLDPCRYPNRKEDEEHERGIAGIGDRARKDDDQKGFSNGHAD